MAGAIPCERPSALYIYMKSTFDQSGAARVQEALKNNNAGKISWKKYLLTYFQGLTVWLKTKPEMWMVYKYGGFKTRDGF